MIICLGIRLLESGGAVPKEVAAECDSPTLTPCLCCASHAAKASASTSNNGRVNSAGVFERRALKTEFTWDALFGQENRA